MRKIVHNFANTCSKCPTNIFNDLMLSFEVPLKILEGSWNMQLITFKRAIFCIISRKRYKNILGHNSSWDCHISVSNGTSSFYFRPPFPGWLYSKQPWKTEIVFSTRVAGTCGYHSIWWCLLLWKGLSKFLGSPLKKDFWFMGFLNCEANQHHLGHSMLSLAETWEAKKLSLT